MIATTGPSRLPDNQRVVITGVGLTAPNGNSLPELRDSLLQGRSGVREYEIRYFGKTLAGICDFDVLRYQARKEIRRGTCAGGVGIYSANEAVKDSGLDWPNIDRSRVGVYVGVTEHGNVETENEIHELKNYNYDTSFWSHHHNPRTVANNPAGEIALNMGITGPHYTIGAALRRGQCGADPRCADAAAERMRSGDLRRRVGEHSHVWDLCQFPQPGALAQHADPSRASRPFDMQRNGIVVAEGGCLFIAERLDDAKRRGARIYGELAGYAMNTDATDFVLPNPERQAECMELALKRAGLVAEQIDIVSTHATGTASGDSQECIALRRVFGGSKKTFFNNTKSFIGHSMGAAGALELAGNFGAFEDGVCHATINVDELDPECALDGLVLNQPREIGKATYILNNSFGMLGINSVAIIKRY